MTSWPISRTCHHWLDQSNAILEHRRTNLGRESNEWDPPATNTFESTSQRVWLTLTWGKGLKDARTRKVHLALTDDSSLDKFNIDRSFSSEQFTGYSIAWGLDRLSSLLRATLVQWHAKPANNTTEPFPLSTFPENSERGSVHSIRLQPSSLFNWRHRHTLTSKLASDIPLVSTPNVILVWSLLRREVDPRLQRSGSSVDETGKRTRSRILPPRVGANV